MRSGLLTHRRGLGLAALITVALFAPFILEGRTSIDRDMWLFGVPSLNYLHQMAVAGRFWAWNPYSHSGTPTVAASMGTLFYPLSAVFLLVAPLGHMVEFLVLHQLLALTGAFAYLKWRGYRPLPCCVGSLAYAFAPTRLYLSHNLEFYAVLTYAPLVLLSLDWLAERPGLGPALLLAAATAVTVLGGNLQLALVYAAVYVLYAVWRGRSDAKPWLWGGLGLGLGFGLASLDILPLLEFLRQGTTRASASFSFLQATADSICARTAATVPFPLVWGPLLGLDERTGVQFQEHSYAVGLPFLFLAALAFGWARRRRRAQLGFFAGVTALAAALALGRNLPGYGWLLEHVPGLASFRVPARYLDFLPLVLMVVAAAATEALEVLCRKTPPQAVRGLAWLTAAWAMLGTCYGIFFLEQGRPGYGWLLGIELALPLLMLWGLRSGYRPTILGAVLLAGLSALNPVLFVAGSLFVKPAPVLRERHLISQIKQHLGAGAARITYLINPGTPMAEGVADACTFSPLTLKRNTDYLFCALNRRWPDRQDYHRLLWYGEEPLHTTRDLGLHRGYPMYQMLCSAAFVTPTKVHFERLRYPGFWFSRGYRVLRNRESLRAAVADPHLDPTRFALLGRPPAARFAHLTGPGWKASKNRARITSLTPDRIEMDLNGESGWLTLSQNWYPGWQARVDGRTRPIYCGYTVFRTIPILPTDRRLELTYDPAPLRYGAWTSAGCAILWILGLAAVLSKRYP